MTLDKDPNNWWSGSVLISLLAAIFGRLTWLGEKSGKGRRIWTWNLLFEIPTAVLMVWVGRGLGEHMGLGESSMNGLIGVLAYLGPKGLGEILNHFHRQDTAK